jgi:hypothetical protein
MKIILIMVLLKIKWGNFYLLQNFYNNFVGQVGVEGLVGTAGCNQ